MNDWKISCMKKFCEKVKAVIHEKNVGNMDGDDAFREIEYYFNDLVGDEEAGSTEEVPS